MRKKALGLPSHSAIGMTDYMLLAEINVTAPFVTNTSASNHSECCSGSSVLISCDLLTQPNNCSNVTWTFHFPSQKEDSIAMWNTVSWSQEAALSLHTYAKRVGTPMSKGSIYDRTKVLDSGWSDLRAALASSGAEDPKTIDTWIKLDNLSR